MFGAGNTQIVEATVEEAAQTYVSILDTPKNAWGNHLHPQYGDSANARYLLAAAFGRDAFNSAVDARLSSQRFAG